MQKNESKEFQYDPNWAVVKTQKKRSSDECYTPNDLWQNIEKYASKRWHFSQYIRPFYPDEDYTQYTDQLVFDNPPFSILSKIIKFYTDHNVKFILFCPILTSGKYSYKYRVIAGFNMKAENGVIVKCGLITNLESAGLEADPDLAKCEIKYQKSRKKRIVEAFSGADAYTEAKHGNHKIVTGKITNEIYGGGILL